ncbi:MAG TPA: galactose oxidase-like domain-containing protein [Planctomycetota bacterium]
MAQGVWSAPFDHKPNGPEVHPASDSLPGANPGHWITENIWPIQTPGQRFRTVHTCLIPSGPFRGCLLVWDGNLTLIGTRAYQPWAIVDPYWPSPNPFVAGGGSGYRFHNATLQMPPGQGELFCAGQRWVSDGRLFVAGGTRVYPASSTPGLPPVSTGMTGMWEGAKLVYQWDPATSAGFPFGRWWQMADLDVERWYPTVSDEGSGTDRFMILGGTDFDGMSQMPVVNTYESYRVVANALTPQLAAIDQKAGAPPPPPTARQYQGLIYTLTFPQPVGPVPVPAFTDYPRIHALGVLDPISGGQFAPRQFVSGFWGKGFRWAHDPSTNPTYATDVGQELVDSRIDYSTNILQPAGVGAIGTRVVRIGGSRATTAGVIGPEDRVESVVAGTGPSTWSSGTPNDIPDMVNPRVFASVVMLPTGDWVAVGGFDGSNFVLEPELLTDGAPVWRAMAPHTSPRQYHACSVLLPDGRVMVCGGEARTSDYEIWSPSYLQVSPTRRPANIGLADALTFAPVSQTMFAGVTYGQTCIASWSNPLPAGVEVSQAVLIAPAALTHHDDGGQRLVRLLTYNDDDVEPPYTYVKVRMPTTIRHAPPGWYMLFLVTNERVPSMAFWVNLR